MLNVFRDNLRHLKWVLILVIVTVLAEISMPWVLMPFVPGFLDDPAKFDLTVLLTRILFPYLACMSLMAAYAAILNSLGRELAAGQFRGFGGAFGRCHRGRLLNYDGRRFLGSRWGR